MSDVLNRAAHEAMTGTACICPIECDCENVTKGLLSEECPIHNETPYPTEGCPAHSGDKWNRMPDYCKDLNAAAELEAFTIEKVGAEKYGRKLHYALAPDYDMAMSFGKYACDIAMLTAEQRTIACLKALGKMPEGV